MKQMLGELRKTFVKMIPDWFLPFIAMPYWALHPHRETTLLLHRKNHWFFRQKDGTIMFKPKTRFGLWAEPYERYFEVKPGETVLDAGACVGEFTVRAAKRAKEVVAIEPSPENRSWLRRNISENGLQNVRVVGKAAWNCRKTLRLYLSEDNIGGHSIMALEVSLSTEHGPEDRGGVSIEVQADTLDNIVSDLGIERVDFVKMDIEGAEVEALEGAKRVLGTTRKIALETHPGKNGRKTTSSVQSLLESNGFVTWVESNGIGLDMVYGQKKENFDEQKTVMQNAGYISGHHAHEELANSISRNRYEIPARDERSWASYFLDVLPRAWSIPRHDVIINEGGRTLPLVFLKAVLRRRFVHIVRSNDMFFDFGALPWYKRLVLKFTARYIDGVIAVSDMIEECVRKNTSLPVRKVNTFVKDDYLGIQPDLSARNIIAIGTRYPQKGNDILAEVDKRLREHGYQGETFVLGRERAPEFIKDYSRNQPHFHLTGFVDNLKDYLAKGCFYVHPARFDAAGCSVVEAMAAGLIPIVSERTGNKEVVNKVDPELVLENTPESFYRKLSDLMELSEPELIVFSDRAKEVASAYTFDKIKEDFRGAVRELMHDIEGRRHAG